MFDDVFGSSSSPAVPGDSVTKPFDDALPRPAPRYMSGGPAKVSESEPSPTQATEQDASLRSCPWPRGSARDFSRLFR